MARVFLLDFELNQYWHCGSAVVSAGVMVKEVNEAAIASMRRAVSSRRMRVGYSFAMEE